MTSNLLVIVITETKLLADDTDFVRHGSLPDKYSGIFKDRKEDTHGGGIAVLFRDGIHVVDKTKNYPSPKKLFELLVVNVMGKSSTTTLVNIYRPPSSSLSVFLEELSDLIQNLILSGERWIIGGDINCPGNTSTTVDQGLMDILEIFDLRQWVKNETHDRGGLLDVVITHVDVDFILGDVAIDLVGFSDHLMLSLNLNLIKDHRSTLKTTKQRSFKNFNHDQFKELFLKTSVVTDPADNVDSYIEQFNESIVNYLMSLLR